MLGPRLGAACAGRFGRRAQKLRFDLGGDPRRPVRALLSGRSEDGGAGPDPLARRGVGGLCQVHHERHDDPAGTHRAGQERRGGAHAQPQADLRMVLRARQGRQRDRVGGRGRQALRCGQRFRETADAFRRDAA